jgi:hypothetical protein
MSEGRRAFVDWFRSLTPEEATKVWWDCDAATAAEVRASYESLVANAASARARISELDAALAAAQLENEALRREELEPLSRAFADLNDGLVEIEKERDALLRVVEAADKMRSWYDKQMGPDGYEVEFDQARAALDTLRSGKTTSQASE